jgi:hypothetical protein
MVAILRMVTILHMVASGDRCFLATGGRQILPQKTLLCAARPIDFRYRADSYLQW